MDKKQRVMMEKRRVLLVSGMSGSGKSSALKILEDLGYEAIDNLPLALLMPLVSGNNRADAMSSALAVGIDSRTRGFDPALVLSCRSTLQTTAGLSVNLLFLDTEDAVLQRRFSATRRRHPLAADRPLSEGIAEERILLRPLQREADEMLDTSALSLPEFRRWIEGRYGLSAGPGMTIAITSFSYRHGLPRDADLVFDARFLNNPHYYPTLQALSGEDEPVGAFIRSDPAFITFHDQILTLLGAVLPRFLHEGRTYLTLAVGCTGGRHRSVFVAKTLSESLQLLGHRAVLTHRDLHHGAS